MTIPDEAVQAALATWPECGEPYSAVEQMGKALSAAQPFLQGVKVKALEWHDRLKTTEREGFICSEGGVLSYSIMLSKFRVYGIPGPHDGAQEYETLEAAKAAAQADYEARILSAIEPAPSTDQEPIGYLFQHEDTGLTQVVEVQQVEWGFEKNNPRWQKISPVYSAPVSAPSPRAQVLEESERITSAVVLAVDALLAASKRLASIDPNWEQGHLFPSALEALNAAPAAIRALSSQPVLEQHTDDIAVDRFANAMKIKLNIKRAQGRGGWEDKKAVTREYLSYLLLQNCMKGSTLNVANLAMMLHQRGEEIIIDEETATMVSAGISSQPVADGWLPMTHPDLPLNGVSVEVFDSFIPGKDGFGQVIARFDKTHGWHVSASVVGGIYIKLTNPTHWRPLPASPGASE